MSASVCDFYSYLHTSRSCLAERTPRTLGTPPRSQASTGTSARPHPGTRVGGCRARSSGCTRCSSSRALCTLRGADAYATRLALRIGTGAVVLVVGGAAHIVVILLLVLPRDDTLDLLLERPVVDVRALPFWCRVVREISVGGLVSCLGTRGGYEFWVVNKAIAPLVTTSDRSRTCTSQPRLVSTVQTSWCAGVTQQTECSEQSQALRACWRWGLFTAMEVGSVKCGVCGMGGSQVAFRTADMMDTCLDGLGVGAGQRERHKRRRQRATLHHSC